ncbi:MAG: 50S ribosomal protein L15 [Candidatus Omnitrophica bacterium]|nr:50S ribosomal protein L15 [Candidatus Omnitrophota bacterium]MBU1924843.1 50S ribosomal protein L15 [Candidatus Omnitrophota bacterium]
MLKLNDLRSPKGARKKKKILGRGSGTGHGKTSGRGHKGQLSRTGKTKRPGFEGGQMPLIRRIPKRGFNSKFRKKYQIVNLDQLNRVKEDTVLTAKEFVDLGLVRKRNIPIKVLGNGKLSKRLTIQAAKFSITAKKAIEDLGGKTEIVRLADAAAASEKKNG